jgi:hypothetical protein
MDKFEIKQGSFIQQTQYFIPGTSPQNAYMQALTLTFVQLSGTSEN